MSKSAQPIEFVQEMLAQLPIIEVIIQQAVGQLPNIEDIRHSSSSLKIYSQLHSSFKQILGSTTQELSRNSITNKNLASTIGQIFGTASQELIFEFVQQAVAHLPSIEDIERELQGIDGGDA
jgi:hypothetical protein